MKEKRVLTVLQYKQILDLVAAYGSEMFEAGKNNKNPSEGLSGFVGITEYLLKITDARGI